jgi:hypothetical protein
MQPCNHVKSITTDKRQTRAQLTTFHSDIHIWSWAPSGAWYQDGRTDSPTHATRPWHRECCCSRWTVRHRRWRQYNLSKGREILAQDVASHPWRFDLHQHRDDSPSLATYYMLKINNNVTFGQLISNNSAWCHAKTFLQGQRNGFMDVIIEGVVYFTTAIVFCGYFYGPYFLFILWTSLRIWIDRTHYFTHSIHNITPFYVKRDTANCRNGGGQKASARLSVKNKLLKQRCII